MNETSKYCPFCGHPADFATKDKLDILQCLDSTNKRRYDTFSFTCDNCFASGPLGKDKEEAVLLWITRRESRHVDSEEGQS